MKAHSKSLGLTYQARVQLDMFEDLFTARVKGSGAKIPRAMENCFLEDAKTMQEKQIQKAILEFTVQEVKAAKTDLTAQKKRLAADEKTLLTKITKKAQNDQRIATSKIETLSSRIELLESGN